MRKISFTNNQFYHIFNRGVDKRKVFTNRQDFNRFFQGMDEFNVIEPIGSLYANSYNKLRCRTPKSPPKLVNFICYCLNPNHFHFILEQIVDNGISEFMKRLGGGYTNYFNLKNERSGVLFQGKFKAVHIDLNEYLLHVSAYVNLNNKIHGFENSASKSSWKEYVEKSKFEFCKKDIILKQFKNPLKYKRFAEESLKDIKTRREIKDFLIE